MPYRRPRSGPGRDPEAHAGDRPQSSAAQSPPGPAGLNCYRTAFFQPSGRSGSMSP